MLFNSIKTYHFPFTLHQDWDFELNATGFDVNKKPSNIMASKLMITIFNYFNYFFFITTNQIKAFALTLLKVGNKIYLRDTKSMSNKRKSR